MRRRQSSGSPPCPSASTTVKPYRPTSVPRRPVDDVAELLAARVPAEVVGEELEEGLEVPVLGRGGVRRDEDVRRVPERVAGREGLGARDVEDGGAQVPALERVDQ